MLSDCTRSLLYVAATGAVVLMMCVVARLMAGIDQIDRIGRDVAGIQKQVNEMHLRIVGEH